MKSILRNQWKWQRKKIWNSKYLFNGIVNEKNQRMRRIQSVIQKLWLKFTTYENATIVVTWTELYRHFWIKTITESVFMVSKKNILKVSHLNCVGKCRSMRDIDKETIGIDKYAYKIINLCGKNNPIRQE